jgi:2-keto-4-pentenoate hydratase
MKLAQSMQEAKDRAEAIREFDKHHPNLSLRAAVVIFRFKGEEVSIETYRKARNSGRH